MAKIYIHVYDLHSSNDYLHSFGVGAYHTGVEVYGVEYAFGGGDVSGTGVFESTPKVEPTGCKFRETLVVGETKLTRTQVRQLIVTMSDEYKATTYHVLNRNCNAFSNDLCLRLTEGKIGAPSWINRLSSIGSMFSFALPANQLQTPNSQNSGAGSTTGASSMSGVGSSSTTTAAFSGQGHSLSGVATTATATTRTASQPAAAAAAAAASPAVSNQPSQQPTEAEKRAARLAAIEKRMQASSANATSTTATATTTTNAAAKS